MRKNKEPVRLRSREVSGGNRSLYLDIYCNGERKYEYLRLYLVPEKTRKDKEENIKTMQLAEAIRAQRIVEFQNGRFGFHSPLSDADYFAYAERIIERKKSSGTSTSYYSYMSMLLHLRQYHKKSRLPFREITKSWVEGFVEYLRHANYINKFKDEEAARKAQEEAAKRAQEEAKRAQEAAKNSKTYMYNRSNDFSTLRTAASSKSGEILKIPYNGKCEILGESNGFYYVNYNGNYGYVRSDLLSYSPNPTPYYGN